MMSSPSLRRCLMALICAAATTVSATPLISDGSSYGYRLRPGSTPISNITGVTFDGTAESFLLSDYGGPTGRNVTIDESQTDLGGGAHSVAISLLGDGDLFPTASEFGYINIGFPGANPLDLLRPARLVSAVLSMYAGSTLIGSADFVAIFGASFSSLAPWDGFFISPGTSGGFLPVGALGVDRIELNLSLQELPEPQTLALVALSLLMLGLLRRRARGPG